MSKANYKIKNKLNHGNKKFNIKNKFKKNFGSLQEGKGLGFLQKNTIKKKYIIEQRKNRTLGNEGPSGSEESDPYAKYNYDREAFEVLRSPKKKISKFKKAQLEFNAKVEEKQKQKEEKERKFAEIEEKRRKYKEKRLNRYKKISKRTKTGQPLMSSRMELLLEDVENMLEKEKRTNL